MKLFERVIEQRLRSYLEDIGFINKYQSGSRKNKSTDDHLFRLSQSVMESFNRGEHYSPSQRFHGRKNEVPARQPRPSLLWKHTVLDHFDVLGKLGTSAEESRGTM